MSKEGFAPSATLLRGQMLCTELFVQRTDCCRCLYTRCCLSGSVLHRISPISTWPSEAGKGLQLPSGCFGKPILSSAGSIFENKAHFSSFDYQSNADNCCERLYTGKIPGNLRRVFHPSAAGDYPAVSWELAAGSGSLAANSVKLIGRSGLL